MKIHYDPDISNDFAIPLCILYMWKREGDMQIPDWHCSMFGPEVTCKRCLAMLKTGNWREFGYPKCKEESE